MNSEKVWPRQHAFNLLKLSKKFLLEDGDLDPTAFILTANDQLVRPIELNDDASKSESCAKIVDEARQKKAIAIIAIFLARSKSFARQEFDEEGYSWGDIQDSSSDRCILMTLSGPGMQNWAVAQPFRAANDKIVFEKPLEFKKGVKLGLFPGWSDQIALPRSS